MAAALPRVVPRTDWSRLLKRRRAWVILVVAVAAVILPAVRPLRNFIPLLKLEQASIDFRFRLRGYIAPSPKVAIVGIMASSLDPSGLDPRDVAGSAGLKLINDPFPWNRKVYALLLDRLFASGAKVVAIDLLFLNGADGDADFAAALKKYGDRVVIASMFAEQNPDSTTHNEIYRTPLSDLVAASSSPIVGCATLPVELDGVIRRAWYYTSQFREFGYDDTHHEITSLAGLAALKYNPGLALPDGDHLINYQGPDTTVPYYPIEDIFTDRVFYKTPRYDYGAIFKDKIVFVGPAAEIFHDVHNTIYGNADGVMPGVEIHAQIASSLLLGDTISDPPAWLSIALSLAMALAAVLATLKIAHPVTLSGFTLGGLAFYVVGVQAMFVKGHMLVPMVNPAIAFVGPALFGLVFNFLLEQLERARIRSVLDRYVSRSVAELVLSEREQFEDALRGQKRHVTALFSDIRGFTSITEESDAATFVEQLNEYFYRMVDEVLKTDGTLQQFIGDAIMAIWGNTHTMDPAEGARQAVATALAMSDGLDKLNIEWATQSKRVPLSAGIGIHHGEVIVGSIGHPQRMEFTTIGDGINTAARLESSTKFFGCRILIGGAVEEITRSQFIYRRIAAVKFKGKQQAVEVYTVLGAKGETPPDWLDDYHAAIDLYRAGKLAEAAEAFEAVKPRIGPTDRLCSLYEEKCATALAQPSGEPWDPDWVLTEK
jgi:adenylate cyclase